jgi:tetratricopeptide (TPR) repeat protein
MKARTLACCTIVLNEGARLRSFVEKVRPHVDAVYLVDTGSTDDTVQIAGELDVNLVHLKTRDLAAARNLSLRLANQDYILSLDVDEQLSEHAWRIVRNAMKDGVEGLGVQIANYIGCGELASIYRVGKFFKHDAQVEYTGEFHENNLASFRRLGWTFQPSEVTIHHFEGLTEKTAGLAKCERSIARMQSLMGHASREEAARLKRFLTLDQYAIGQRRQAIDTCARDFSESPSDVHLGVQLAQFFLCEERVDEAEAVLAGLQSEERTTQGRVFALQALVAERSGKLHLACELVRASTTCGFRAEAQLNLGVLYLQMGELDAALHHLRAALADNPVLLDPQIHAPSSVSRYLAQNSCMHGYRAIREKLNFWGSVTKVDAPDQLRRFYPALGD